MKRSFYLDLGRLNILMIKVISSHYVGNFFVKLILLNFLLDPSNASPYQGHWTNSQPHNGIPVDHTDLQTQLPSKEIGTFPTFIVAHHRFQCTLCGARLMKYQKKKKNEGTISNIKLRN